MPAFKYLHLRSARWVNLKIVRREPTHSSPPKQGIVAANAQKCGAQSQGGGRASGLFPVTDRAGRRAERAHRRPRGTEGRFQNSGREFKWSAVPNRRAQATQGFMNERRGQRLNAVLHY